MKLRTQILLFFLIFALTPLITAVVLNLPLVLERMELFYHKAHLQNLRADFRDLDQHLASRDEMVRLLAKLPEPGSVLGNNSDTEEASIDAARARYTQWINQILRDQLDIIQIVFLDPQGYERFWLERNQLTQRWQPTLTPPDQPKREFIQAGIKGTPGNVLVSPISLDPEAGAKDPRRFMTLHLQSTIGNREENTLLGAVLITIDVGGIARYYRNTLWVHDDGRFLEYAESDAPSGDAFARFPGLQEIFENEKAALWKGDASQIMWLPMFRTENSGPLWVGRWVDPSPISQFRNALTLRVLTIVLALALAVWFAASWVARRVDRISNDLIEGVQRVLQGADRINLNWRGPEELKKLAQDMSLLANEHGKNIRNLRLHTQKLEESNRYKSEFLANVSHELKTPLNSILLLSKLLAGKDSGLMPEQRQQAQVIHKAGSDLQALIDNILDLSRIEARRATISEETVSLPELLRSVIELVEPQFHAKALPLSLEIAEDAPQSISTDPDKVRQVLKNFLSNALKFTETGQVKVRLERAQPQLHQGCEVRLSVIDDGIGIPDSQQAHIFDAFQQADGSTSRRYGGTGLGLTISQQLSRLLGGFIELESSEGQGARFSLLLPLEIDRQPADEISGESTSKESVVLAGNEDSGVASPIVAPLEASGHKILLVDDEISNLLALTPVLESWGLEVTAAGDGLEALEVLEEDEAFSFVLMDTLMPKLNGYDTISRIRSQDKFQHLVIIALPGEAETNGGKNCLDAGANDVLTKPVAANDLLGIINKHLPHQYQTTKLT